MIKEFEIKDAQKLADMFNASDEGWPGGFTHGMPITAEMVVEERKKENTISTLVAWDRDEIVGIVELTEFWRDTNILYVAFLNVVPSHQGKGYGRDLLKTCVQKSTESKCNRLDVHTWSGNMKAVPVYKKTGFFWVPKTLVHMKNFIPLIMNVEAAKPYFEKHDWYQTFKREIRVEEDDLEGVFPYFWEEDDDILSVVIDAESGGIAEFENSSFSVSQKAGDAFAGNPAKLEWKLKNKTDTPLKVNLVSRGEKGIQIEKRESLILEEEYETTGEAFVDPDIEIRGKEEPPHMVTTDIVIEGVSLSLVSGLRVKRPIEVSSYPEHLFLPRGKHEIPIILKNNQKKRVESVITCQNTGETHTFSIEPEYTEAVQFTIDAAEEGDLQFVIDGIPFIYTLPVRVLEGANVMQKEKEVILENSHFRLVVSLLGGETSILDKRTGEFLSKYMTEALGPPFWPSELIKTIYTVKTEQYFGKATAEFVTESKKYNLRITRRIEIDSSQVVKIRFDIIPQKDVHVHLSGERLMDGGILTLPLKTGIISEPAVEGDFPARHGDIPKDPSEYREQWMCYERDGSAFGLVWEECTEVEPRDESFLNISMNCRNLRPLYLYLGSGTWKDVRALWSQICGKELSEEEPLPIWDVRPSALLCVDDEITQEFTLETSRGRPMKGHMDGKQFEVKKGNPFTFQKKFEIPECGVTWKYLEMETDLFHKKIPVPILRVGKRGEVSISEKNIIEIKNGLYITRVASHFCGSVIFFGREVNNLLTSYPEPTQLGWFRPWFGGIHPLLFIDEEKFPGWMHKEAFTHRIVSTEKCNIPWKGVKVICTSNEVKGIQLETQYLTTAFSNLLVIEHALVNLTSAPFTVYTGVSFYLQPEGSLEEATLYYEQNGLQERRRTSYGGWTRCRDWAAVKGKTTFLTLIADSIVVADMGKEGAHLYSITKSKIPPFSTVQYVSYLVAADSLEQSQNYKFLRGVPWK